MWLLLVGALFAAEPSAHTVLYYNARMALREGRPAEATRLWLLRNALEDRTRQVSRHDADFRSVTWAALGQLGVCPDGLGRDKDGSGLWPLALHNYIVRNLGGRRPGRRPRRFDSFDVGRQSRSVAIGDVLSAQELSVVELSRGRCLGPRAALVAAGEPLGRLSDRQVAGRLLRSLLEQSRRTLTAGRVRGLAAVEARLFDLDLQLIALAAREARQEARAAGLSARQLGLSPSGVAAMGEEAPRSTLTVGSTGHRVLQACVGWPVDEWMSLAPDRRLFLHGAARDYGGDAATLRETGLGVLDVLLGEGQGAEVSRWIGHLEDTADPAGRERIWGGERGALLLGLDDAAGFRERSVIALHRGVDQLSRGDLRSALRSFGFARAHASESLARSAVEELSLRWLGFVAAQFELDPALLVTLAELVPGRDYATLLEDLMWTAAFNADLSSFEAGLAHPAGRGALERRLELLRPLASGRPAALVKEIRRRLSDSPSETLSFLTQLVERLEREPAELRASYAPTLAALRALLAPLAATDTGRAARLAGALHSRMLALEEGTGALVSEPRGLSAAGEVYAGSVRLAPVDQLPWPFTEVNVAAPSVFVPLELMPVEWRDPTGELVFGWQVRG